jgi:hypothetical protein
MASAMPLFALGFSQLWMLGWLAAAALPILIHLWNKRRYREVTWAAMEYLLAAIQRHSRRLRIEQWLLLAIRTAIILLVVFAVAGPYFEQLAAPFIAGRPTHKVIVIDGSYSMAYRPAEKSRFDRARELAAEIVEHSRQGDAFTLVLMATPPRVIVGTPSFSASDFLQEVQNLKLQHGGADLGATLAQIDELLETAARDHSRLVQSEIYFLTDLGRTTWESATSAAAARAQINRLAERASLSLIDLGQPQAENLAITDLRSNQSLFTTTSEIDLEATVRNFGAQPQQRTLELVVDGQRMSDESFEVSAGGEASVAFKHRFDTPGEHSVEVRLATDSLPVDNYRWLAVPVKKSIATLLVNGESNPRAANYLRFALDPDSGQSGSGDGRRGPIQTDVVPETALLETDLNHYDCVFLSNVGQLTSGEAQVLSSYLKSGGGLVFFLGNRVLADRYNTELAPTDNESARVLPVLLEPPVNSSQYSFNPREYRHPIVAEFRGNERAGLLQSFITRYVRMRLFNGEKSKAQVALEFAETGDPAIVTEAIGRGRVTVVALPASLESVDPATKTPWTLMTATQSFQPIVQEILAWTLRGKNEGRNALVGEPITAAASSASADISIAVQTPDGRMEQVRLAAEGDETRWSFADTWASGLYQAEFPQAGSLNQLFGVNVDTAESDLTKVALEDLPPELTPRTEWQDLGEPSDLALGLRGSLHRPLLYAALVLLLVESVLAWFLGYRSS